MCEIQIPALDSDRVLRHVRIANGYRLFLWDTYRTDRLGKSVLGFAFYAPEASEPLFCGEDFAVPSMRAIDSDESLRSLLGFLTLKPGDTDADYFASYTPEQMAFAQGDAEYIACDYCNADDSEIDARGFEALEGDPEYND
jgi:hypothetical protein